MKPVKVFRCGAVQAAVWANQRVMDNAVVEVHSVRFSKSYKEGDEWKRTTTFTTEDLPKVALQGRERRQQRPLGQGRRDDPREP